MQFSTRWFFAALLAVPLCACGGQVQPPDGNESGSSDSAESEGSGSDSGSGGDPTESEPACVEAPEDGVELLNACTDSTCAPFANTPERLPLLTAEGSLPPLP